MIIISRFTVLLSIIRSTSPSEGVSRESTAESLASVFTRLSACASMMRTSLRRAVSTA